MKRIIKEKIEEALKKEAVVIIIGQRQIGKTVEVTKFLEKAKDPLYIDFEDESKRDLISKASVDILEGLIGGVDKERLVVFDEIQHLRKSGSVMKLIHDHFPRVKVIATGSSSFLMLKNIGDSLYGRHIQLNMYPLTLREIVGDVDNKKFVVGKYQNILVQSKIEANLERLLIYGSLPKIYLSNKNEERERILKNYTKSLLFKDIFEIEGIRYPQVFRKLLKLLALQIGNEVNVSELAQQLEISKPTVLEYIELYEKFQLINILRSYSTNPRKELSKGFKVYFVDLGIRNALIENFTPLSGRTDRGEMFENFVVNMFHQNIDYYDSHYKLFFWRTYLKAEVDLVLHNIKDGSLIPIEIKFNKESLPSKGFINAYKDRVKEMIGVNKNNLYKFI